MIGLSGGRILAIAKKEFFHLRRDRLTGGMVVGIPLVMTLLFGYGINQDVRDLQAVVVDEANTSASRGMVADAEASQVIRIVGRAGSTRELEAMIASAEVSVGIYIPFRRISRSGSHIAMLPMRRSSPMIATRS